jgi:hypothetical protein
MSTITFNQLPDAPPSKLEAAGNQPKRNKTMTEAALAANRANAKRSTGPRTEAGKLKSASNALQHGLYSLTRFEHFIDNNDFALEMASNILDQFEPITPAEHLLAQQLLHLELRFLQMESLYNQAMIPGPAAILENPPPFLTQLLRELNQLPNRIQRAIKALHTEIARRQQNPEIEPIPDQDPLPAPSPEQPKPEIRPNGILFDLFAKRILMRHPSLMEELQKHQDNLENCRVNERGEIEPITIDPNIPA